jgi:hypothetical protein
MEIFMVGFKVNSFPMKVIIVSDGRKEKKIDGGSRYLTSLGKIILRGYTLSFHIFMFVL